MIPNDLYKNLEKDYTTEIDVFSYFSQYLNINEALDQIICKERFLLNYTFSNVYPEATIKDKDTLIEYCKNRADNVLNRHLVAKYNEALLVMSHNNQYATIAIEAYMEVLNYYLSTYDEKFHILEYFDILEKVISLYQKYKKNGLVNIKRHIMFVLFDTSIASSNLKLFILQIILDSKKLFTANELKKIPSLCIDLYNKEADKNISKNLLEYAIAFSKKTKDTLNLATASELLGDLKWDEIQPYDKNIAISHMNEIVYEKIIKLYKDAKNKEKLSRTKRAYEANKIHHRYIHIPIRIPIANMKQGYDKINELIKKKMEETPINIIASLCFHNIDILLPQYEVIKEKAEKSLKGFYYTTMMGAVNIDAWGNKTETTHEQNAIHQLFHRIFSHYSFNYIILLIYNAMKKEKINPIELKKVLETAGFDVPLIFNRNGKQEQITMYSILNRGLDEFLIQCENYMNEKEVDWRFCIDFLTPKFESIIRMIAQKLGIPITEVFDNGTSQLKTLEKILQEEKIKDIFNDDDLFLFKHTFIKEGMNIRNNVAHGLLMPVDYTAGKAMLVFLSVLRLSKATMYFQKQNLREQGIKI